MLALSAACNAGWPIAVRSDLTYARPVPIAASAPRKVRLFQNGRNQAVHIPREFELPGKEAVMRKEGNRLILEPTRRESLVDYLRTAKPIDEPFPEIEDRPPEPFEL